MRQSAPDQLSIPGAAVGPPWKSHAELVEALDHGVGGTFALKQLEDRSDRNCTS
jgi:hypothetical protein